MSGITTRRELLINAGKLAGSLVLAGVLPKTVEAAGFNIENIPHEASLGRDSYPWLAISPSRRSAVIEVIRKYSAVDLMWNSYIGTPNAAIDARVRKIGFNSFAEYMNSVFDKALIGQDEAAAGMCRPAAVAAMYAPLGTMEELIRFRTKDSVIEFSPYERKMLATLQFTGMAEEAQFGRIRPDLLPQISSWVASGLAVAVDFSTHPNQEWYGLVVDVQGDYLTLVRYLEPGEWGKQVIKKHISQIIKGEVLSNRAIVGSARGLFNPQPSNFILGTQKPSLN